MAYKVYNKKMVREKGLMRGYLRTFKKKKSAEIFVSGNPDEYIIKES